MHTKGIIHYDCDYSNIFCANSTLTVEPMALLDILHFPDPRLRNKAQPVVEFDDSLRRLVDDMFETMYDAPGIGLAATQVNVPKRVIVIDLSEAKDSPLCLVNPELASATGEEEMEEGCLSVPGFYEPVQRAAQIRVRAFDATGKPFEMETAGLLAVCIQHEIDHLQGKLFVDYLSPMKRNRIQKKLEKEKKRRPAATASAYEGSRLGAR
jgi:peptide deformylase